MKNKLFTVFFLFPALLTAQDVSSSLAFKANRPKDPRYLIMRETETYTLLTDYILLRKANEGDPMAEQELGIRYLTGNGFKADTAKSAFWIRKAASKNLTSARYNMGIFLNKGWGVEWNPFEAFRNFRYAAMAGMPEAEFVYGLFLTDNLVVPRNLYEAYKWIKKSASAGFDPAKKALGDLRKNSLYRFEDDVQPVPARETENAADKISSVPAKKSDYVENPVENTGILDLSDTLQSVNDLTLIQDIIKSGVPGISEALAGGPEGARDSVLISNTRTFDLVKKASEAGSPEALAVMGRCYENGLMTEKDNILAAVYYIRALRLDSFRAYKLLAELTTKGNFIASLKNKVIKKDSNAMFVWAALAALHLNNSSPENEAMELLQKAASKGHLAAINELALCYYTGSLVKQDKAKAIEYWNYGRSLGSRESELRVAAVIITDYPGQSDIDTYFRTIGKAASEGSVIACTLMGYCFEKGVAVKKDYMTAAEYYRKAAERGSRPAFSSLLALYNLMRPADTEFQLPEVPERQ